MAKAKTHTHSFCVALPILPLLEGVFLILFLNQNLYINMKIAFLGSESIYSEITFAVIERLGKTLSLDNDFLTGGTGGSPYELSKLVNGDNLTHILPVSKKDSDYHHNLKIGNVIFMGKNMEERREYLINTCDIAIMLEGGPGTADEATIAINQGKLVYCFPITGGASNGMFFKDSSVYDKIKKCTLDDFTKVITEEVFY